MAHRAMHTRNDSGVSVNSIIVHENPPSPTLTIPEMIIPIPPWERQPEYEDGPHPLLEPEPDFVQINPNDPRSEQRDGGVSADDVGVAAAMLMPIRFTVPPPTTIHGATTPIPTYTGYEHGAPLSDIYEESEATATPKSTRHRSPSPESPTPMIDRDSSTTPTIGRLSLRHKKRHSSLSTSSSGGSDVGDWENFDSSKVLTSRVAADLAQLKREESLDVDDSLQNSRRQSREEEELAALNARAEKILENARKRLTHMSDNLKNARNSIVIPNRSPNLGGEHQPVGGLYRSISAAGATKLAKNRQNILPVRTTASLQHMRGLSDVGVSTSTSNNRLSRLPEARSMSALEYGSPSRYSLFPEPAAPTTTTSKTQPSPISTKSYNSPLRPLEEERDSPSTAQTTPESVKGQPVKGLGIHNSASVSQENLAAAAERSASRQTSTPTSLTRSGSAASMRSTKDLKDQMTQMKSKIADLKSKAQADTMKRRSISSIRSSSPFTNGQPDQWYASSPAYQENSSPISAKSGVGARALSPQHLPGPVARLRQLETQNDQPHTPLKGHFLGIESMTPDTEIRLLSSVRTDRNTPLGARDSGVSHLARKVSLPTEGGDSGESLSRKGSTASGRGHNEDDDTEDTEKIAENEEEQIYLNEVLEESLREAEVETDVPPIPEEYLNNSPRNGSRRGPQRHEDRVDAFDYENMFLHSAMGNYAGHDLVESDSGSNSGTSSDNEEEEELEEEEEDDNGSVETSRLDAHTPVDDVDDCSDTDESQKDEPTDDDESEAMTVTGSSPLLNDQDVSHAQEQPRKNMHPEEAQEPPKSWIHARSKSADSVSTSATFETATEGERFSDEEQPSEIYNWNPAPASSVGYSPNSHQAYRSNHNSPAKPRHGFSSPQGGGRTTPVTARNVYQASPLRHQQNEAMAKRQTPTPPGLGLGVIGGENAQYINNNGVPERFQGHLSAMHSRQSSTATLQHQGSRPLSQATVVAASPKKHQRQQSAIKMPLTPKSVSSGSPVLVTVTSSPQRKVVVNRSLQRPEGFSISSQRSDPPNVPLPDPPSSSAALQAQMVGSRQARNKAEAPKRMPPAAPAPRPGQQLAAAPQIDDAPPSHAAVPNTEVLMESLIKLADPEFMLAPGMTFEEVDKNLVLNLLGAVGGVCNDILHAGVQSGSPALSRVQADAIVDELRGRLHLAAETLSGALHPEKHVQQRELRMKEI